MQSFGPLKSPSFEKSFEYFSNSFVKEVFKGLFKGLFKGPKYFASESTFKLSTVYRLGICVVRVSDFQCMQHFVYTGTLVSHEPSQRKSKPDDLKFATFSSHISIIRIKLFTNRHFIPHVFPSTASDGARRARNPCRTCN